MKIKQNIYNLISKTSKNVPSGCKYLSFNIIEYIESTRLIKLDKNVYKKIIFISF